MTTLVGDLKSSDLFYFADHPYLGMFIRVPGGRVPVTKRPFVYVRDTPSLTPGLEVYVAQDESESYEAVKARQKVLTVADLKVGDRFRKLRNSYRPNEVLIRVNGDKGIYIKKLPYKFTATAITGQRAGTLLTVSPSEPVEKVDA